MHKGVLKQYLFHYLCVSVDVTQAGEGQLEIMVDGGTIPNHVSMIRKGVFKVDFVPKEARAHKVDIRFNGMNAPCMCKVDYIL